MAAAALLVLGVGIGIGHYAVPSQPASPQVAAWTFSGNLLAPSAIAHLIYFKPQRQAVFEVTGLPALSPGQVYETWLFRAGVPIDWGVSGAPSGSLINRMNTDLSQYSTIAITIEAGEQAKPTTQPILTGNLRG